MKESPENEPNEKGDAPAQPGIVRRLWNFTVCWRMARHVLIGMAGLLTLVAIVWVFEGIRGKRAWEQFEAEMAAMGEALDPEDLKPAPVPDLKNFAMTPLLAPLLHYEYKESGGRHQAEWRDPEAKKRVYESPGIEAHRKLPLSDRHKRLLTSLADWQAALRDDTNFNLPTKQISMPTAGQTNGRASGSPHDFRFAAKQILSALSKYDPEMNELHTAADRPHAQFPIHYDEGFGTLLPHLSVLRKFGRIAHLKTVVLLEENRPDEALRELELIIRFTESFRDEPFLISGLVHIALNAQINGLVWEGIARGKWEARHLAAIEKRLRQVDMISSFRRAIRGERAMSIRTFINYRLNSGEMIENLSDEGTVVRWAPSGVFYQNLVHLGRMYDEFVLPAVDFDGKTVDLKKSKAAEARMEESFGKFHLYLVCAKAAFPAFNKALQRYAEGQVDIDQARLACAIEQYRLANDRLPAALTDLIPTYLPKLPHDPVNGESYVYKPDGKNYVMYSLGVDDQDNGGKVEWSDKDPNDRLRDQGDWAWYSAAINTL